MRRLRNIELALGRVKPDGKAAAQLRRLQAMYRDLLAVLDRHGAAA